jgi:hypothetical protein
VIEESGAGYVVPSGDGAELAEAAVRLASLAPEARAEMGTRAVTYCGREFDRTNLLSQLEGWMESLRPTPKTA